MNLPTREQYDRYQEELNRHIERCGPEPKRESFNTDAEYLAACEEWDKKRWMDAPNSPGYSIANND